MKIEMHPVRKYAQTYIFPSGGYQTLSTKFTSHSHAQTDSGKLTVVTHLF